MSEERLIKLETKIAYQDKLLADLNKIIYEQSLKIDRLELSIKKIKEEMEEKGELNPNTKPPHY